MKQNKSFVTYKEFMTFNISTVKRDGIQPYKTYVHADQGTPGEGSTPFNSIKDWAARTTTNIELYEKKHISLAMFAQLLGISLEEAKQFLEAENISVDLGVNSTAELQEDIKNA